ncbi:hypothetical protein HELRODRAFT_137893, partial [Helobdella robusta]|uniref:VWFD domain-containing protein n=1 Tax=Helobdella robusta TaxID=6412 RepID=T1EIP5_HELRO
NGDYVEIQTSFGLTVSYNPLWRLKVTVTSAFSNQVTGSCGNFDGNPSNDVKMVNGA